jgi:amino acid transporter
MMVILLLSLVILQVKLKKSINVFDLIFLAFGAMIGWGWVVASGGWIQNAGVLGTVIGFVLGGLMIFFVGLIYAELTTAMPQTGGEMIFSYRAFGPRVSFVCTWAIILSYIGVVCFEACSFPTILQYIFPGFLKGHLYTVAGFEVYATWLAVAILSALLITYINVRGVKVAARFQNILTAIIAIVGVVLVAVSAINGEVSNIEPQLFKGTGTGGIIKSVLSIAVIAPFFLFGFDVIPQAAEEINVLCNR